MLKISNLRRLTAAAAEAQLGKSMAKISVAEISDKSPARAPGRPPETPLNDGRAEAGLADFIAPLLDVRHRRVYIPVPGTVEEERASLEKDRKDDARFFAVELANAETAPESKLGRLRSIQVQLRLDRLEALSNKSSLELQNLATAKELVKEVHSLLLKAGRRGARSFCRKMEAEPGTFVRPRVNDVIAFFKKRHQRHLAAGDGKGDMQKYRDDHCQGLLYCDRDAKPGGEVTVSDRVFLATRDFTAKPAYGARSCTILVPPGVKWHGHLGHSVVLDLASGAVMRTSLAPTEVL